MAGTTGLEPAASAVTDWRSKLIYWYLTALTVQLVSMQRYNLVVLGTAYCTQICTQIDLLVLCSVCPP